MNKKILSLFTVAVATVSLFISGCNDEVSGIGNSITSTEVEISVDSIVYRLDAASIPAPSFESRSAYNMLGSIRVPEYGSLDCSYVTQFLPSETINIPDTITWNDVDSVKMILSIPKEYVTGDTLALQQLKVYSLTKELPGDISSDFNPEGYYNPASPLSVKSYTLSGYSFNDSTYSATKQIEVKAKLPVEIGKDAFKAYKENPEIFVWPQEFAKYWPGVYVTPSFGKGCVSPVMSTSVYAYFPKTKTSYEVTEEGTNTIITQVADSVCLFTTAPEVLSNVNISYIPSDNIISMVNEGKSIITTPGGFVVRMKFPAKDILNDYWEHEYDLGVINNMVFSIPAKQVANSYGLGLPPAMLLIKTSEMDSFFAEGKLPDNMNSFTSLFSSTDYTYTFSSMRKYIVSLKEKGADNITDEDVDFTLIPVNVATEEYTDPSTYTTVTAVTSIAPYIVMPTLMELETDKASIVFTYSNQTLN